MKHVSHPHIEIPADAFLYNTEPFLTHQMADELYSWGPSTCFPSGCQVTVGSYLNSVQIWCGAEAKPSEFSGLRAPCHRDQQSRALLLYIQSSPTYCSRPDLKSLSTRLAWPLIYNERKPSSLCLLYAVLCIDALCSLLLNIKILLVSVTISYSLWFEIIALLGLQKGALWLKEAKEENMTPLLSNWDVGSGELDVFNHQVLFPDFKY